MGSSSKKHSKRVSSKVGRQRKKDKFKKRRRRDVSSNSSDEYSSSTDSEDKRKLQKKNKKKVKRRSQRSRSPEARPHSKGKANKRRSRSVERQKTIKKKRKLSLSTRSTCSDWSDSSNDERGSRKWRKIDPQRSGADRKRKRKARSPSRSSCSTFSRSSHEFSNQQGSIDCVAKKIEDCRSGQSYRNENNSETLQSYDDYPSSISNESYDYVERVGQIESADCHKLPASTDNNNDLSRGGESKSDDQVEAMLRQKALENLAIFRNKHVATTKESSKLDEEGAAVVNFEKFEGAAIVNSEKFDSDDTVRRPLRLRSVVVAANMNNELSTVEARSVVVAANVINELPTVETGEMELCGELSIAKVDQVVHAANAHEFASRSNSIKADEPGAPAAECTLSDNNKAVFGTSSDSKGEADGGNQLQQKTMNVMRGSELVQVTYKVHIPKTTPALARRRLQR